MSKRLLHLRSPSDLDGRTLAARVMRDSVDTLVASLGGEAHVTAQQHIIVKRAAFLSVVAEHHETQWLETGTLDHAAYLPAVNTLNRLLGSLGLERRAKDAVPNLRDYIRQETPDE